MAGMTAQWEAEKERAEGHGAVQERLKEARLELERAERAADFARAAELRHGEIPELERAWPRPRAGRRRPSPTSTCPTASAPTRSPRSSRAGPASRSPG